MLGPEQLDGGTVETTTTTAVSDLIGHPLGVSLPFRSALVWFPVGARADWVGLPVAVWSSSGDQNDRDGYVTKPLHTVDNNGLLSCVTDAVLGYDSVSATGTDSLNGNRLSR